MECLHLSVFIPGRRAHRQSWGSRTGSGPWHWKQQDLNGGGHPTTEAAPSVSSRTSSSAGEPPSSQARGRDEILRKGPLKKHHRTGKGQASIVHHILLTLFIIISFWSTQFKLSNFLAVFSSLGWRLKNTWMCPSPGWKLYYTYIKIYQRQRQLCLFKSAHK